MRLNLSEMSRETDLAKAVLFSEDLVFSLLTFCDDYTRAKFLLLSSFHRDFLTSEASFKWRIHRLHIEKGVYHSSVLVPNSTWKDLYLKNRQLINLWALHEKPQKSLMETNVSIKVTARFKPKNERKNRDSDKNEDLIDNKKFVLPLHQRLALIRMDRKLKSNSDALKVLRTQGDWFRCETKSNGESKDSNILFDKDKKDEGNVTTDSTKEHHTTRTISKVAYVDKTNSSAVIVDRRKGFRKFSFDHVLPEECSQQHVYEITTMPLVADFINGCNATCLVYGQTGSGKTFTMFGSDWKSFDHTFQNPGIVPRVCSDIFEALEFRKQNLNLPIEAEVSASYIEIYGNEVNDLLRERKACGQSKAASHRYVLEGSAEMPVKNLAETKYLLHKGELQKRTASTAMNQRSSRAHSLFILTLRQKCSSNKNLTRVSRFFLADLGGSEQLKKSQPYVNTKLITSNPSQTVLKKMASATSTTSQRVEESININLGLLALKQCVRALRKKNNAPYSDSKLTLLLSTGLGGDSKTSLIVCGSQEVDHVAETISSLKFGQECRGVVSEFEMGYNSVSENTLRELLATIDNDIQICEANIRKYEKWEIKEENIFDDKGKVIDVKKKTTLTGAGEYRQQLASLIRQKCELTGDNVADILYSNRNDTDVKSGEMKQNHSYDTSYFMR